MLLELACFLYVVVVPMWTDTKIHNDSAVIYKLFIQNMEARLSCPTNLKSQKVEWLKDGRPFEKRQLGKVRNQEEFFYTGHVTSSPCLVSSYQNFFEISLVNFHEYAQLF